MSADAIRLIVDSLNAEPFLLGINLISFDNFSNERLLQTTSDVLCWIFGTERVDIRVEQADQTAMRILRCLKILKFKPPTDIEHLEEWRAGIVEGSKASIYPVLVYIFSNVDTLKERAYLSNYLMKIDVPSDIHDMDTAQLQNEIGELMEQFKIVHQRMMELSEDSAQVEGIKADLKTMEAEKEQISRRIEKIELKIRNIPNIENVIQTASQLRTENERIQNMEKQKADIRLWNIQAEKKLKRLEVVLEELKKNAANINVADMMEQLQGDIQTNTYLAEEKLAKEIETRKPIVAELSKVVQGSIDEDAIRDLQAEIDRKSARIRELTEERDKNEEGHDENFSIYRHQTTTVERKKAATAQKLQDARTELEHLEAQISEKKRDLLEKGEEVITAVQFKNYVAKLRQKTAEYKKKRRDIEELTAENNILARTSQILSTNWNNLKDKITDMGGDVVEINFEVPTLPARPKTAAPKTENVEELRMMVKELSTSLERKTQDILPLKRTHNEELARFNEMMDTLNERKREFERRKTFMESSFLRTRNEVEELESKLNTMEVKLRETEMKLKVERGRKERLDAENQGAKPFTEELEDAIRQAQQEADALHKKGAAELDIESARRQKLMWKGLLDIFSLKIQLAQGDLSARGDVPLGDRAHSRMVL